jgi:hypothetical protein
MQVRGRFGFLLLARGEKVPQADVRLALAWTVSSPTNQECLRPRSWALCPRAREGKSAAMDGSSRRVGECRQDEESTERDDQREKRKEEVEAGQHADPEQPYVPSLDAPPRNHSKQY